MPKPHNLDTGNRGVSCSGSRDAPSGRAARMARWIEPALSAIAVALLLAIFARYGSPFALGAAAVGAMAFVLQVRSR